MGLYLVVFKGDDDDEEVDGVDVGTYADFNRFRFTLSGRLEGARGVGSRFPTLMLHADCDGTWSAVEAAALREEVTTIRQEASHRSAEPWSSDWQADLAAEFGLIPNSLAESFIDVDGRSLLDRRVELCDLSIGYRQPIWFQ